MATKKKNLLPIIIGSIVIVAAALYWFVFKKKKANGAITALNNAGAVVATKGGALGGAPSVLTLPTAFTPVIDKVELEHEMYRRYEAYKAKLISEGTSPGDAEILAKGSYDRGYAQLYS